MLGLRCLTPRALPLTSSSAVAAVVQTRSAMQRRFRTSARLFTAAAAVPSASTDGPAAAKRTATLDAQPSPPPSRPLEDKPPATLSEWTAQILTHETTYYDTADLNKARCLLLCLPLPSSPTHHHPAVAAEARKNDARSIFHLFPSCPMPLGAELTLFNPLNPESELRSDGTEASWSPPEGLDQRMWASGSFDFDPSNQMCVGDEVECRVCVEKVDVKRGRQGTMVLVWRRLVYRNIRGRTVTERRCHVYRRPRRVGAPDEATPTATAPATSATPPPNQEEAYDFAWDYLPTRATLFRYSAATFNAHRIHLDPEYCRTKEGHPDCLVHGPLTATLLMNLVDSAAAGGAAAATATSGDDATPASDPTRKLRLRHFDYRATAPLVVERTVRLRGKWQPSSSASPNGRTAKLWALDDRGTVCMTATATVEPAAS
ncbi:uncharacterized protein PFL1_02976 [Pseudozyma flocculosa PF-1]|uniref:Related to HTD2 - mitochondrial 3-hydroxyacyl-thioester dehydratase n=2 Tax=Pseudozyma flocculosa TaxID=84751 RepID=A0A5C3F4K0_9BASI|nr:uncharacterized protein PFL1_02976 [Pseudozyma flocculosa PF-1]EPQ29757.1 hypothetical protein PFL1_02976 [Pseudozyma flocculosa PF-1]SPO38339.1 related to HTD2 - mitochondrial 3-hydroxyacyl-thioester dehydratase [Pseudozyma flocculosa]